MDLIKLLFEGVVIAAVSAPILWVAVSHVAKKTIDFTFSMQIEKIKHDHAVELEGLRVQLNEQSELKSEISKRKLNTYNLLVEMIYRLKNGAIALSSKELNTDNTSMYMEHCKMLEDFLYSSIVDLQSDKLFDDVHALKNKMLNFGISAKNELETKEPYDLATIVEDIRTQAEEVINAFSAISVAAQGG